MTFLATPPAVEQCLIPILAMMTHQLVFSMLEVQTSTCDLVHVVYEEQFSWLESMQWGDRREALTEMQKETLPLGLWSS